MKNVPDLFAARFRFPVRRVLAIAVSAVLAETVQASEVTGDTALAAVESWVAENRALSRGIGSPVSAKARRGEDGRILWYEVATSGGGCVVASADTEIEPIVAVLDEYDGEIPPGHPLEAMLALDMRGRLDMLTAKRSSKAAVRATTSSTSADGPAAALPATAARQRAMRKWAKLSGRESPAELSKPVASLARASTTAPSGEVLPVKLWSYIYEWSQGQLDHWNQNGWNRYVSVDSLYDKYTPNHYPCGCVATAGAALLQFFGVTTAPDVTRTCSVDGTYCSLSTKGQAYDWTLLGSFDWKNNAGLTESQIDLVGRATYDMGVCLGMEYAQYGSSASIHDLAKVLRNDYGLADARYASGVTSSEYEKLIYNQVRGGRPVVLSIKSDWGGHAVLAVGYGEDEDATAYTRVFMGWGGASDAWYALPNIEDFQYLDGVVTMIGRYSSTVPLCARITTSDGGGAAFEPVSVNGSSGYRTTAHGFLGILRGTAAGSCTVSCRGQSRSVSVGSGLSAIKDWYSASELAALLPDTVAMTVPATGGELRVYGSPVEARAEALARGKALFVLSGADWCSHCAVVKNYLKDLGAEFADRFVLYYANIDCDPYGMGSGAPRYAVFDPRVFDYTRGWAESNGLLAEDAGGVETRVQAVIDAASGKWDAVGGAPTRVAISAPDGIVEDFQCGILAAFPDGTEASLASETSWSLVSGTAARISADGVLSPVPGVFGDVVIRAVSTVWGSQYTLTKRVSVLDPHSVSGLALSGPSLIDLYDVQSAQFKATCRSSNGTEVEVSPEWTIEETAVTNAVVSSGGLVTFPNPAKYSKASRLTVTAKFNGMSASRTADVWGWGVSLSSWTTPQRVVWPGQTMEVVPRTVTWWRHGKTEEPTTDLQGVEFGISHGWVNDNTYLRSADAASGAGGLAMQIPSSVSEQDGTAWVYATVAATRLGRTVSNGTWASFKYLASAPSQTVDVTFLADGGEPARQTTKYAAGCTYGYLPEVARTGYSCSWHTAAEGGTQIKAGSDCLASVTRLYAQWSPNYYRITYDANGGAGSMSGSWFYYDTPANLRANAFTKDEAVFAGWATSPDGPAVYRDEEEILNLSSVYADIALYAVWVENGYKVVFDANGGTGEMAPQMFRTGTCSPLNASTFTRRGATFAGWARTPDGRAEFADGGEACDLATACGETVTLYAVWTLPAVATIRLSGPDAIDLYDVDSARFTAVCLLADGTVADVAPKWTVEETAVTNAVVSADGLVTFPDSSKYTKPSRLRVTAECNGASASKEVDVWGWSVSLSSWTSPQRVVWPGRTLKVVPCTVTWWRHGATEEPTTDFTGVSFSAYYGYVNVGTYLNATDSTSGGDGLVLALPDDLSEPEGRCYMVVKTEAARFGKASASYVFAYFKYLPSAPSQTVDVTFVADGGEPATQKTEYAVGCAYGYLPTAVRTGYSCSWHTAADGGTQITAASDCLASVTRLYAQWSPNYYRIVYDANGGAGSMSGSWFDYDTPANLRANAFTKEGAVFAGWATVPGGPVVYQDGEEVLNLSSVYAEIVLYAVWSTDYYCIEFDANGGTGSMPGRTCLAGSDVVLPICPFSRSGYSFEGWAKTRDGSVAYADGAQIRDLAVSSGRTVTLYAVWKGKASTVTLNRQNGTGGTASVTATYGSAMPAIAVPTRTGYVFGGYYTAANGGGTQYYTASGASARNWDKTSAATLYAKWTVRSCTVTLDRQGGTGGSATATATYGSAMPSVTVPSRTGYAFGGYYSGKEGSGTQYYSSSGTSVRAWDVDGGATLYAKWTASASAVTLSKQGGTGGTASVTATYDSAMPDITVPTRTGYAFGGYYTAANGGGAQYYTAAGASARNWDKTSATTLYAKWTANSYAVTFDRQNGTGGSESVTATYGSAMPAIAVPTRTGYAFGGYYTAANGGGVQFYTAAGASARNWNRASATTLYAKWVGNTYNIALDSQNGSGGFATATATYGSAMPAITVPTRTGYAFGGYFTAPNGGGTQYYTASGASARNWDKTSAATLYAKWTANSYAVALDRQNGTGGTATATATYGSAMPAISVPTRTGYAFGGYYTAANGGGTQYYTASGASARNWDKASSTTLYAKWSGNAYDVALDPQNGSGRSESTTAIFGSEMPAIALPARTGYAFGGYYTAANGGGTQYYTAAGTSARNWDKTTATTLYALWAASNYKIVFDKNGGTGKMAAQAMTYDKAAKLRKNAFARKGWVFIGWSAKKSGPVAFANAASVKNLTAKGGTVTLYAQWAKANYKVAFVANGGTGKMAAESFVYGKAKSLSANKFKAPKGKTFAGWAKSKAAARKGDVAYKNKKKVKNLVTTGKTVKLYAVWKSGK